jgi:hypothetical protein
MVIHRRSPKTESFRHALPVRPGVEKAEQRWTICSIVQKVLWSDGKSAIHRGVAKA